MPERARGNSWADLDSAALMTDFSLNTVALGSQAIAGRVTVQAWAGSNYTQEKCANLKVGTTHCVHQNIPELLEQLWTPFGVGASHTRLERAFIPTTFPRQLCQLNFSSNSQFLGPGAQKQCNSDTASLG